MIIPRQESRDRIGYANRTSVTASKVCLGFELFFLLYSGIVQATPAAPLDAADLVIVTPDTLSVRVEASAQREDDHLTIRGSVQRQHLTHHVVMGHIDVKVFGDKGDLLLEHQVSYRPNPVVQRPTARSRFDWRIPAAVSVGSRIELSFHTGNHALRE